MDTPFEHRDDVAGAFEPAPVRSTLDAAAATAKTETFRDEQDEEDGAARHSGRKRTARLPGLRIVFADPDNDVPVYVTLLALLILSGALPAGSSASTPPQAAVVSAGAYGIRSRSGPARGGRSLRVGAGRVRDGCGRRPRSRARSVWSRISSWSWSFRSESGVIAGVFGLRRFGRGVPRRRAAEIGLVTFGLLVVGVSLLGPLLGSVAAPGVVNRSLGDLGPAIPIVVVLAFLAGAAYATTTVSAQTALFEHMPEQVRGRVFGVLASIVSATSLLPILIAGPLADAISASLVLTVVGAAVVATGLASARLLRPTSPD